MKPAIPWSVKGVEHETREAAKAAARRAGMTLGQWLNHVVQQSGEEVASARSQLAIAADPQNTEADTAELTTVLNRLDALENHQNAAIEHLEHALEMLASRVPPQGQVAAAPNTLEPRLAQLEAESKRRFDRLAKELGMIANRYSDLEERQDHGRQEVAQLLEELAKKPAPPAAGKSPDSKLIDSLERRFQAMDGRLEAVGRDARSAATTFQQALSSVMGRVVEGERRHNERNARFDARIESFESKIDGLSERLEEVLTRDGAGEAESIQRLEQMVNAVTRQFEVVESRRERSHIAMEKTLRALAERLADTDRRHTQQVEEPLAALHQAVEDMSKRIADTSGALEERLSEVTERLEQGDTEFRASRFSMMHAVDDTRRRLESLEAGQAPLPPLVDEPGEPASKSRFEPGFEDPAATKRNLFSALAAQSRGLGARDRIEAPDPEERAAAEEDFEEEPVEDPPMILDEVADAAESAPAVADDSDKATIDRDPVGALLAAAREAARARGGYDADDSDHDDDAVDATFSVEDSALPIFDSGSKKERDVSRRLSAGRSPKIALAVGVALAVIAAGVAALWLTSPKKSATADRPGVIESLLSDRSSFAYERAPAGEESAADTAVTVPLTPSAAPPEAVPLPTPEDDSAFIAPPAPASNEELASLSTSAIADVRAAATPEQRARAAEKVTQAAMLGDPEAQFTLGRLYETGQGVKTDTSAARRWYEEAASRGHAGAAFNLGMMEARLGMPEAYVRAADWFTKAARKGYADAQYNLAMLYSRGLGVGQDTAEAYAWFAAAASRGDEAAAAERDRLAQGFDPVTRARAEALAKDRIQG